jgi:hypothetical protein
MASKSKILSLYKTLIKESNKFSSYNFREYAKRRIKYEFEENKAVTQKETVRLLLKQAESKLESLKRQVIVSQLFPAGKNIIEPK